MRIAIGALSASLLAACGTSTAGFVGTWTIPDGGGTESFNCPGQGNSTLPVTGEILIIQGQSGNGITSSSTIVATIAGQSETFTLTNSTTASLQASTPFPVQSDGGSVQTLTLTSDNMIISGDNLSENASGTIAGGDGGSCTFSRNISATQGG